MLSGNGEGKKSASKTRLLVDSRRRKAQKLSCHLTGLLRTTTGGERLQVLGGGRLDEGWQFHGETHRGNQRILCSPGFCFLKNKLGKAIILRAFDRTFYVDDRANDGGVVVEGIFDGN